ncbi:MAG TPA: Ig-like domain-containing protein, partial [Terriglobia bacterium]|nr:Ig-like domain-containing protein [Terriglobia bacterium]
VNFVDGTTTIGSGTLNASGQASFTTSLLAAGTHSITAVYAGNATFATSTSAAVSEVVNPLTATTTVLVSSLNPANVGQSIGFTVTVTAATGGIPSGAVTFRDGTTSIGSGTLNASGQAVFTTSTLTAGTHPITAVYAGNAVFATSTSTAVTQLVNATGTSTATVVTSSVQPSTTGQAVTLRAAVTASSGSPSGTVTFMDGASPLGTGTLSGGAALLTTSALAAGFHIITAVYSGGGTFAGSASPILYQVVITRGQARSATILTSSSNPSTTGQNVSLAAAVTASGGYSASSTFDGAAQIPLSEGGRWTTPVNPATTLALQSDGNHHILVSGTDKPGVARYVGQVFLEDQFAQATISGRGGSTMEGVFVRMQSDTNPSAYGLVDFWGEWYSIARFDNNPGEYRLIQTSDAFNGGRLKDFAVVPKVGDVIRLEITGDTNPTLTAYVNGTLLGSVVDHGSSDWAGTYPPLAGGQPAVFLFKSGGSDIPEFSNWSTGDLGAPAGVAVPTGAVTFIDGTTVLGTATLNGAGQTTLDISTLSAGSYPIVAVYGGDAKYVGSSSPVLSQGVSGP